jgi:hypothetical protein
LAVTTAPESASKSTIGSIVEQNSEVDNDNLEEKTGYRRPGCCFINMNTGWSPEKNEIDVITPRFIG